MQGYCVQKCSSARSQTQVEFSRTTLASARGTRHLLARPHFFSRLKRHFVPARFLNPTVNYSVYPQWSPTGRCIPSRLPNMYLEKPTIKEYAHFFPRVAHTKGSVYIFILVCRGNRTHHPNIVSAMRYQLSQISQTTCLKNSITVLYIVSSSW